MKNNFLKEIGEYLDKHGINYTIDNNPSPDKIKMIKASIKRREELEKLFVERYKKKNEI